MKCALVAMSGTVTRRSLHDYAHLLRRCLGPDAAPIPKGVNETEDWADAMDETKNERRVGIGALSALRGPEEEGYEDPLEAIRRAYRRRLVSTVGVVATEERFEGASLSITAVRPQTSPVVARALNVLRSRWELPDGTPLADGLAVWRHAREIALGFWYEWQPPPPKAWLDARREWCAACRKILGSNRRQLDSELAVTNAVGDGFYPDAYPTLDAWRAVRDTYKPTTVPVWLDDGIIEWCARWASEAPGIVWTEHDAFARRLEGTRATLSQKQGKVLRYFGAGGMDAEGTPIEEARPEQGSIIASIASNSEGRNLQAWSRNLVVSPPASGSAWEQLIGRTHREGQDADEVSLEFLVTCEEHTNAFEQALRDAAYVEQSTGAPQKLLYADVTL